MTGERPDSPAPLLTVTGSPTAEELAALIAVITGLPSAPPRERTGPGPLWSRPGSMHRRVPAPGPGSWRASGLPGPH